MAENIAEKVFYIGGLLQNLTSKGGGGGGGGVIREGLNRDSTADRTKGT